MKTIKKIILTIILVSISIGLLVVGNGYDMYKEAIEKVPLKEKIAEIKEKDEYTKIEEVPDEKVRPDYLCTFCQMPSYPECKEWCSNFKN